MFMTLVQLEYIIAVDKHRHFVDAAEDCNVTQPTLSMQIKKLEEDLGVIIFDRNKQPIEPTVVGLKVIEQARAVLRGANQINDIIVENREGITGTIKIGIIPTIASYLVPLFVPILAQKYPGLDIQIEEWMTHQVVEQMRQGHLDIGIVSTPLSEEDLIELPLYYEPFVLYVSPDHPLYRSDKISSRDLNIDEMWLLTDGHCFRNHVLNICGQPTTNSKLNFSFKTGSLGVLMRLVEQYQGYTLLPYLASLDMPDEQRRLVREFKEPSPKREISIIVNKGFQRHRLIEILQEEIRQSIPANIRHLDNGKLIGWKQTVN
jgi:LysR family transcriptional regulator, hydrogen peroxide-inducible genes activator